MKDINMLVSPGDGLFRDEKHILTTEPSEIIGILHMRDWVLFQLQSVEDISDTISWYALIKPRTDDEEFNWKIEVGYKDDSRVSFVAWRLKSSSREEILKLIETEVQTWKDNHHE